MSAPAKPRRANGPIVALVLLAICGVGFIATVWNYTRNHAFAREAFVESNGSPSLVKASFPPNSRVQTGQRVVIHIPNDSAQVRGGIITSLTPEGVATIETDDRITASVQSRATVSIDGTVGPQALP